MSTATQARLLHPLFQGILSRHLEPGAGVLDSAGAARLLPGVAHCELQDLLASIDEAFYTVDREMGAAAQALDASMEEAVQLNTELRLEARHLEDALKAKGAALDELSTAKSKLLSQEKLASIGTLAAGIAHEINTPTQFVSDNLSFLQGSLGSIQALITRVSQLTAQTGLAAESSLAQIREALSDPDLAFSLEEIPGALQQSLDGIERVAHIVRSMKEFSHPGNGNRQSVDVNRNIQSTITVCRNEWKYVTQLETELEGGLPLLPCVPGEINQVVLNLIVNAVHAIQDKGGKDAQGEIKVSSRRDGEGICISVSDSGCGIPEAIRSRIFDPFFTTKEVGRGTGQGLAIAHTVVVVKHHGRLTFDTETGKGTTFHLWLPLSGSHT